jgi:RNA polymerase sigma-70 factor (sigma-E family)
MDPSGEEAVAMVQPTAIRAGATDPVSQFEDFVAVRSPRLLTTAYLLTHDHGRAEDLLQTSLAKLWLAWSRVEDPDAYVRKVMVTTYASWWRRKWRGERPSDALPEPPSRESGRDPDMWAALARLPRGQRVVLVLRFYEDLTEAETARILDCTVGTVKSQSAKGLAKLRNDAALVDEGRGTR